MAKENPPIRRSKVLMHPLIGGQAGLMRESGLIDSRDGMWDAWSRGLDNKTLWRLKDEKSPKLVTNLIYDEATRATYFGLKAKDGTSNQTEIIYFFQDPGDHPPGYALRVSASQISSLSLSPSRILLVTMLDGFSPAVCVSLNNAAGGTTGAFREVHRLGGVLTHSSDTAYWASSANPCSDVTSFAIATSKGALVLNESQGRWTRELGERYPNAPEVMAVDWLGPNVMMKGCKDGGVRLWDIRSHGENRESRIQHPSQINHVRRIDENIMVVAGLESQLCSYDLRSPSKLVTSRGVTQPYTYLGSYVNLKAGHLTSGFDVHGKLAAASTDGGHVKIWEVKRGVELMQAAWKKFTVGHAICVRFTDGENDGKVLKLMAAAGDGISAFSW